MPAGKKRHFVYLSVSPSFASGHNNAQFCLSPRGMSECGGGKCPFNVLHIYCTCPINDVHLSLLFLYTSLCDPVDLGPFDGEHIPATARDRSNEHRLLEKQRSLDEHVPLFPGGYDAGGDAQ